MKISLNALEQIHLQSKIADPLESKALDEIVRKIGSQIGEVEQVIDLGKKYEGIIVAKVVSCEKHTGADKLKLCRIDDGGKDKSVNRDKDGLVQVVCGAPNVKEGMLAAWLPPGTTVPATFDKDDPLVLEAREIRGQISNGMLASPSELGISDDHDGILEVDKRSEPGDSFAQLYKLDDYIIDIENKMFTHRPDCFGLLGVAREISGIYGQAFKSPDWYVETPQLPGSEAGLKLDVVNEIPELVPRFCAVAIEGVNVSASPVWLQVALAKFGIKPINNIVDLTNFYMMLSGQPIHAYDYDKVRALSESDNVRLIVRHPKKGEKITTLGGKTIEPMPGSMMVAADKKLICVGGAIGGSETEVDESTKNIIIEAANWDANTIRKTSMAHGIFTESVTRFTKGQSSAQNLAIVAKIMTDTTMLAGGKIANGVVDSKGGVTSNKAIEIDTDFINSRLGLKLSPDEITSILENVEFKVEKNEKELKVAAPFWRTDIHIPEDVVEEVGRLYGYDNLPVALPRKTMSPAVISNELKLKQLLRENLSALGANEVLSYNFVKGDLLDKVGQDKTKSYKIKNALSPDLEYYRQSITPSLLEKTHPNIKAGYNEFALFELGKVHIKGKETNGLPDEQNQVGLLVASKSKKGVAFYTAKKYLVDMFSDLGIAEENLVFEPLEKNDDFPSAYYHSKRAATVKLEDKTIGLIGEYDAKVTKDLKLPEFCVGFEIDLEPLEKISVKSTYQPLSKYPAISQDLTVKLPAGIAHADLLVEVKRLVESHKPEDVEVEISTLDIYGDKNDPEHKQVTLRFHFISYQRTLTTKITNLLVDSVSLDIEKTFVS